MKLSNRVLTGMGALALWALCGVLSGPVLAADDEQSATNAEYSKGTKLCMACHKEGKEKPAHEIFLTSMGISGDPNSPFADGNHGCESCHGPSAAHTKKNKDGTRPSPAVMSPCAVRSPITWGRSLTNCV